MFRAFNWVQADFNKHLCYPTGDDPNRGAWPHGIDAGAWGPMWNMNGNAGRLLTINQYATPEQIVEFMVRNKVSYLTGWANWVHAYALAAESMAAPLKLDAIFTFSTPVSETVRADCLRIFGAPIHALYASKEVYNIAHQCPTGNHYHVNSELLLVEVLDADDKPCPAGVPGRAVISHFLNTAQPFIRYDLGDQIVMGVACSCGRNLPVIERIEGRTVHMFRFPGRKPVSFFFGSTTMKRIAAKGWQIAQVAPLVIEVRYIPDGSSAKPDLEGFAELVRQRSDPRVEVKYKIVEALPKTPSGKQIDFVCELPPDA